MVVWFPGSVINGVGELNMNGDKAKAPDEDVNTDTEKPYPDCPYLLLDNGNGVNA